MTKEHGSCCRFCGDALKYSMVDLGMSPLCQKHVTPSTKNDMERFYPLHAYVCESCWLVQLESFTSPDDIFSEEYGYFSSYSESWLRHCRRYTDQMIQRFDIQASDLVAEIASNDGYLLQWFVEKGIPVLGIEPTANTARAAIEKGVRTEMLFFGVQTAQQMVERYGKAKLLAGNNVLAHVPDLNDFVAGIKILLQEDGILTMEFPHLQQLVANNQFDTIYHEHFSYFSFGTARRIFAHHGITLFDVEELPTHGGSIRIYGRHSENEALAVTSNVQTLLQREQDLGMERLDYYADFQKKVKRTKRQLLQFLIQAKEEGKTVVGYGAPGKGNTLLNYCGIRTDFLDYTVDRSPHKQGNFLPGTHIPVYSPEKIRETKPDYVLILPWNLKEEISRQMAHIAEWGGKFVVPIPELRILESGEQQTAANA